MGSIRALFIGLMFALAALPAAAAGKLNMVDTITTASGALDVATYYAPDQSAAQSKVALLGISHKISIAFSPGEWPTLTSLWNRAVAAQSGQWQTIGTFDETRNIRSVSPDSERGSGRAVRHQLARQRRPDFRLRSRGPRSLRKRSADRAGLFRQSVAQ